MRTRCPARTRAALSVLAASTLVACYDPAVRDRVVLTLDAAGQAGVLVVTTFKQGQDLTRQERQEILETLDRYDLGRDAWLRGFEKAGATGVTHVCDGEAQRPGSIRREAALPSAEALVAAMPDAIANIHLRRDETRRAATLEIVHIDVPETIRDNRRRLEREIEAWSVSIHELSSRQCDLYDYLAERVDRRRAVLKAMLDASRIDETLEPPEAALLERLGRALENVSELSSGPEEGGEPPIMARMSFSAFDHDFCVRPPRGSSEVLASPGLVRVDTQEERGQEPGIWCFESLTLEDLADRLAPESDPPFSTWSKASSLQERLAGDGGLIDRWSFGCRRYDGSPDVQEKAWEAILPRAWYELAWTDPATPPASP